MLDFKALHLDQTKVRAAVHGFPGAVNVIGPTSQPKFDEYEVRVSDSDKPATLHVYKRGDGRTTLHYKVGKNQSLSLEVAKHVASNTAAVQHDPRPLSLSSITEEEWKFLLESLTEEGMTLTKETHQNAERYKVLASGTDHVFIHRFVTGRFLMQGRPVNAYGKVVDCLCYFSDKKKEVIDAQLATVEVKDISSDGLLVELSERMPSACRALNETVQCIFAPSLALTKIAIDLPDYSSLTFPALRGLEACIKELFGAKNVKVNAKYGVGAEFDRSGSLLRTTASKIACTKTIQCLEDFYRIFKNHRNSLFHADQNTVMSRTLDSRSEAIDIVNSVIFTVEKGFEALSQRSGL